MNWTSQCLFSAAARKTQESRKPISRAHSWFLDFSPAVMAFVCSLSRVGFSAITNVDVRPGQDLRQDFRIDTAPQRNASFPPAPAPLPGVEATITTRLDLPTVESNSMRVIYTPPRVLHKVDILFPVEAKQVRFQGTEVVRAMIHTDGALQVQEVLSSLDSPSSISADDRSPRVVGPTRLTPPRPPVPNTLGSMTLTTQALSQWRFAPAVREGVPVTTMLNIKVDFSLY